MDYNFKFMFAFIVIVVKMQPKSWPLEDVWGTSVLF